MAMSYGVTLLDTNGVRGLLLSLFVVLGLALNAQPALAVTCAQQNATELMQRGDVAATGVVDFGWSVLSASSSPPTTCTREISRRTFSCSANSARLI
jgi:hypothetical protein